MAPASLEEALALRAERGDEATVLAGGTFLGILMNQGFLAPAALLSLGRVEELRAIAVDGGELRLGAMATHRAVERSQAVRDGWPVLARAFSLVASPRVRNQATVGGVLADADYASDPPAMLAALDARAVLRSPRGDRSVSVGELILGYYETCIEPDELLVEVRVPPQPDARDVPQVPLALERGPAVRGGRRGARRRRPARRGRRRRRDAAGLPGPVRRRAGRGGRALRRADRAAVGLARLGARTGGA